MVQVAHPTGNVTSNVIPMAPMRSASDRIRQIAAYEIGGICFISPLFAPAVSISPANSAGLLTVLALIVAIWNGLYSTAFDSAERALTGRRADHRSLPMRVTHAVLLEAGAVAITTPVIAAWTNANWTVALIEDLGLTVVYASYAFLFGLIYDKLFPIDSTNWTAEATNA